MHFKVKIDRQTCIGADSCEAVAPDTFTLDSEGKSVVKKKDGTVTSEAVAFEDINDTSENILRAAKACPVNAIVVIEVDESGNEIRQVWPA